MRIPALALATVATPASAQVPEVVITKTTTTFLEYGLLGAVIVVLLGFGVFVMRALLACMHSSVERQTALVTVIQEQKSAGIAASVALAEMARRFEASERELTELRRTIQAKLEGRA